VAPHAPVELFTRADRLANLGAGRTVRESVPLLGDLTQDFDFNQAPQPPLILAGGATTLARRPAGGP
jgi:hypothetical protein